MRKAQRNTIVATIALVAAAVGFLVAGVYMWPTLLADMRGGRYPLILLALYFLLGPAIVGIVCGVIAFLITMVVAYAVVPVDD